MVDFAALDANKSSELLDHIWVVEVLIFLVPFDGGVFFAGFEESFVDRFDILPSTHAGNEGLGWFHYEIILHLDAERVPSLFDFWILSISNIKVSIDL